MKMDEEIEIRQILWSTNVELDNFLERLETGSVRLTDQDLGDVVSVLERRCRALGARLRKVLTQNNNYRMPRSLKDQVLQSIVDLQGRTVKAKVDRAAGQQAAFWSVLKKIEHTLGNKSMRSDPSSGEMNNDLQEAA